MALISSVVLFQTRQLRLHFLRQFSPYQCIRFLNIPLPFPITEAIKIAHLHPLEFCPTVRGRDDAFPLTDFLKLLLVYFKIGLIQIFYVGTTKDLAHHHEAKLIAVFDAFAGAR